MEQTAKSFDFNWQKRRCKINVLGRGIICRRRDEIVSLSRPKLAMSFGVAVTCVTLDKWNKWMDARILYSRSACVSSISISLTRLNPSMFFCTMYKSPGSLSKMADSSSYHDREITCQQSWCGSVSFSPTKLSKTVGRIFRCHVLHPFGICSRRFSAVKTIMNATFTYCRFPMPFSNNYIRQVHSIVVCLLVLWWTALKADSKPARLRK